MKTSNKLLLLAFIAFLASSASAYDFMEGGIAYDINADSISVTVTYERDPYGNSVSYPNASGSLTIPSTVTHSGTTYSVTKIGGFAFRGSSGFTGTLTIPNSVTYIGSYAFYDCDGFTGSLVIPESVTYIDDFAFAACSGFTGSLTIGNSVTGISGYAFAGCSGFTSLTIGNSVTSIGESAFRACSGFSGSLTIPNSVSRIGVCAFSNCVGFDRLVVAQGNPVYDSRDNCNCVIETATNTLICGIKTFTIPNSVTSIGDEAFHGCSGFTGSLTIPNSVTSIGWEAFCDCSGFTGSLTIGNSLTEIGTYAFSGCSGFTGSLTIPKSVKTIGDYAFDGCSGFIGSLTIPNSVTYIGRSAFYACSGFSGSLTIPNSVKTIGGDAFYGCSGLSSLILAGNGELKVKHLSVLSFNTVLIQSGITGIKGLRLSPKDKVYSYATTPPTCDENAFTQYTAALHVPKMSLAAYASAPYWSNFSNITADAGESVGDVNGDGVVDIDDLNVVINIMVHKAAMADWPMADVDGNGYVDIDDLNVVVNFIVGKDCGGSHEQGDWVDLGLSSGTL